MITFDGPNKLAILSAGTVTLEVTDLWSRWIDWVLTSDNSKYLPAMRSVGGDPLSESKELGSTFFMLNGWRIRPQEASHWLTVNGNLYTDPAGESPFIPTLGAYTVTIAMTVSNLSDASFADIGEIDAIKADTETIIANQTTTDATSVLIRKLLTNKTVEDEVGVTVYDDDDTTILGVWTWNEISKTRGKLA
jgi:hypothetical protein